MRARVAQAVRDAEIEDLTDRPTHLLSYGQKKRVAIAGVLAMAPEVIVADEPTAGLDPELTARLLGLLDRLHASGRTVVISTHDVELALAWADHALVLRRGSCWGQDPRRRSSPTPPWSGRPAWRPPSCWRCTSASSRRASPSPLAPPRAPRRSWRTWSAAGAAGARVSAAGTADRRARAGRALDGSPAGAR